MKPYRVIGLSKMTSEREDVFPIEGRLKWQGIQLLFSQNNESNNISALIGWMESLNMNPQLHAIGDKKWAWEETSSGRQITLSCSCSVHESVRSCLFVDLDSPNDLPPQLSLNCSGYSIHYTYDNPNRLTFVSTLIIKIGRASCRERV